MYVQHKHVARWCFFVVAWHCLEFFVVQLATKIIDTVKVPQIIQVLILSTLASCVHCFCTTIIIVGEILENNNCKVMSNDSVNQIYVSYIVPSYMLVSILYNGART